MLYELKAIRKRSNLSQKEAAEQLGVNPGTYRNWEQCKNQPQKSSEVKRLADFFLIAFSSKSIQVTSNRQSLTCY